MLLQFSIENYKAFKERAVLSMVASNYDTSTREKENVFLTSKFGYRMLKSAVIYGANASGKTKLLEAIAFMRHFVLSSAKDERIQVEPFRLNTETENEASEFEIIFLLNNELFRYGFEVTQKEVIAEWLYHRPHTKEVELFYREKGAFDLHKRNFSKGRMVASQGLVRKDTLLLTVAAQFNEEKAMTIIEWFRNLKVLSGISEKGYEGFTMSRTDDEAHRKKILNLLKAADFGINDIRLDKVDPDNLPPDMPKELRDKLIKEIKENHQVIFSDVFTFRKKYDRHKRPLKENVQFSLEDNESAGTRKFFALTGPILDVLEKGYILVVDELDSKLHPNLVEKILSLFNSKELNMNNAQLIFNTHSTNLLSSDLLRRDQIWFTEKNRYGEASLYSLADFSSDEVRKNEKYEDHYLRGKYGAVPYLNVFNEIKGELIYDGKK